MAYCTKCGAEVEGAFCTKCGTPIAASGGSGAGIPNPPSTAPAVPNQAAAVTAPKKKNFIWWILGGCLGLIIIIVILVMATGIFFFRKAGLDPGLMERNPQLAVAKMMASMDPDIEVLSVDEDRGVIRVRNKKTGETMTVDLDDAKDGRIIFHDDKDGTVEIQTQGEGEDAAIEVRSSEGTMRMGAGAEVKMPDWLPSYPGAQSKGVFSMTREDSDSGTFAFQTDDSPEEVASFYERALKSEGFSVQKSTTQIPGQGSFIMLAANDRGTRRTAHVNIATEDEQGTTIQLMYETK